MRPAESLGESVAGKAFLLAAALTLASAAAFAQAWTPPAGSGSISINAQTLHADAHTEGNGRLAHNIDLNARSLTMAVDYGLTDRLAMSIALPYTMSRYRGPIPHAGSMVDDGRYHGSITDLDLEFRYKAIDGALVVTPFIGGQWPIRNYATLGHASPGRGLTEYSAGFDAGHEATWLMPALFVGVGYSYAVPQRIDDHITVNRSNADVRIAYYVTSRWSLHASSLWQRTHGGLDVPLSPADREVHAHHHDQMLRANHWRASAAVSYSVRPSVDVFLGWATSIRSVNSHSFRTLTAGAGWTFDGRKLLRRPGPVAQAAALAAVDQ